MTPDTIFSEDDGYEILIDVSQIYAPGEYIYQISPHFNQKHASGS